MAQRADHHLPYKGDHTCLTGVTTPARTRRGRTTTAVVTTAVVTTAVVTSAMVTGAPVPWRLHALEAATATRGMVTRAEAAWCHGPPMAAARTLVRLRVRPYRPRLRVRSYRPTPGGTRRARSSCRRARYRPPSPAPSCTTCRGPVGARGVGGEGSRAAGRLGGGGGERGGKQGGGVRTWVG